MAHSKKAAKRHAKKPAGQCLPLLLLVVSIAFATRIALFSGPYVSGDDGGYYVYYTQGILDGGWGGSLLEPSPVIFYASALFALVFGVNSGVTAATCLFASLAGAAVFLVSQRLFGDSRTSLIAAVLTVFSALALPMDADLRKNVAAAFFIPLVFYFLLKAFEDKRYLIPLGSCGILAVMSHKTAFAAGFVVIAYLISLIVFKRKLPVRELRLSLMLLGALLLVIAIGFSWVAEDLKWLAGSTADFASGLKNFSYLVLPLIALSPLGFGICLRKQSKECLFLASWAVSLALLALPQVSGHEGYRFAYLLLAPLAILSGMGAVWIWDNRGRAFRIVATAVIAFAILQFFHFGLTDRVMGPMPNEAALDSLAELSNRIPEGSMVYSTLFRNAYPNYWINGVFFLRDPWTNISNRNGNMDRHFLEGNDVYLVYLSPRAFFPGQPAVQPGFRGMELIYNKSDVMAFKMRALLPTSPPADVGGAADYDPARWAHVSTWLLLPYEAINMASLPAEAAIQAFVGIPLSLLWISSLMLLCCNKAKSLSARQRRYLILMVSVLVLAAVVFKPGFL